MNTNQLNTNNNQENNEPILDKSQMDTIIFLLKDSVKSIIQSNTEYKVTEVIDLSFDEKGNMAGIFSQENKKFNFVIKNNDQEITISSIFETELIESEVI